jgi:outer membrane lipoprotein-sorting protein
VQSNPNGSVVQGTLYMRRPGRMRFEYDAPSQLKIVADGTQVTMWDPATRDFGQWPIGWTAASFLVKEPFSSRVTSPSSRSSASRRPAGAHHGADPQAAGGKIIVRVSENPMQLRGWTIIDNRGNKVDVTLTDSRPAPSSPTRCSSTTARRRPDFGRRQAQLIL